MDEDITRFISVLKKSQLADNIVYAKTMEGKEGILYPIPSFIDASLKKNLSERGIEKVYSHQHEGLTLLNEGNNIIVTTPTGSGKTLIYNLSVITRLKKDSKSKALYIFPTKALAQNQLKTLKEFAADITAEIYDGDTTQDARKRIKNRLPDILITNPDMLHIGILPFHNRWCNFFSQLNFVVIDEVHTYRGIFGSQVAHIIRRLRRICRHYGKYPQFILLSATIDKPADFAEKLTSIPFVSVEKSSSPEGRKHFIFMDAGPESPYPLAINTLFANLKFGLSTILFTQSRKASELLHMWIHRRIGRFDPKVSAYRAGYLAEERHDIEKKMFSGEMKGIISTSALELGIDIGSLDCCILFGYPGSITSTWQRIGRVGRSKKDSIIIFIGMQDALDRYFIKNPEEFFRRKFEDVIINPYNPIISEAHLKCASFELPIEDKDAQLYGKQLMSILEKKPFLKTPDGKKYCFIGKPPHMDINIRTISDIFAIVEIGTDRLIGEIDGSRVFSECYPGSIYLHQGKQYEILLIDIEKKCVTAKRSKVDFYTQPNWWEKIEILEEENKKDKEFPIRLGKIKVTTQVISYEKRREKDKTLIGRYQLILPPQQFQTKSIWIEISSGKMVDLKKKMDFQGSIHAVEHAIIGILPLTVTCDRWDIGGYSFSFHPQTKAATIFIYDGYPGGIGIVDTAYSRSTLILKSAYEVIRTCKCDTGCPSCIQSPKCGNNNNPLDKKGALLLLKQMIPN